MKKARLFILILTLVLLAVFVLSGCKSKQASKVRLWEVTTVSYTHLDVYKRQVVCSGLLVHALSACHFVMLFTYLMFSLYFVNKKKEDAF